MNYPAYEKYKDSGVEWLGEVPADWNVRRLKFCGEIRYGLGEPPPQDDVGVPFIRATDIFRGKIDGSKIIRIEASKVPWHRKPELSPGDILVVRSGAYTGDSAIVPDEWRGALAGYDLVVTIQNDLPEFFAYALLSKYVLQGQIFLAKSRAAQPHLNAEELGDVVVAFPHLEEQKAIADFLVQKTAQIDHLIEKKQALIEKLNEKRTAMITRAVTKGLDESVAMKDSGVEWMGEVPDHWNLKRLKFLTKVTGGGTPNTNNPEYWNGDIPWVSPKDMGHMFISRTQDYITELGLTESSTNIVPENTVLIVVRSGILRHTIPVAINSVPMAINQDMKGLTSESEMLSEYLTMLIYGNQEALLPLWSKNGCTVESIEFGHMMNTNIPIPPIAEQKKILDSIAIKGRSVGKLIGSSKLIIEKLKEYRTGLITAAVTGKIDVRNFKPNRKDNPAREAC